MTSIKPAGSSRTFSRLLAVLLALALVAAGCGDDDDAAGGGTGSGEPTTTAGSTDGEAAGEQVLRMRLGAFSGSLDPAFVDRVDAEQLSLNIYNGLVQYDTEGELVADLAEEWETSDDLTEWTFHLREGVMFHHDYGELTADDVVFSYERIRDPETASFHAVEFENVASFEAPDDSTVVITLTEPDAFFLHSVARFHGGMIVSRAAVEEKGEGFGLDPVGTGPFYVESLDDENGFIEMVRFDDYFDGPATLERIELTVVEDTEAAAIALQNNEFDVLMDLSGDERLQQLEDDGFVMHNAERSALVTMLNPQTQPAFADPRVRQAFAHCIDFTTIIETLVPKRETRSFNIFSPSIPEYTDDVARYDYDPELGRQLLAEAGYADGLVVKRLIRGSDGVEPRDLLEQEYLAECGVTEEFDTVEVSAFSERRFNGDFEIATRSNPEPNIDFLATSLLHPDQFPPAGLNGSYYDNPEVTALIEEARRTLDEDERTEMYHEMQRLVMGDLPYIPENVLRQFWPAWDHVEGMELNGQALLHFENVSIGEH